MILHELIHRLRNTYSGTRIELRLLSLEAADKLEKMTEEYMSTLELASAIYKLSFKHSDDAKFKLRSGKYSNSYYDKYFFESMPKILKDIAIHMLPDIPKGTEALAGLELGGIPVAVMLSQLSDIPVLFVRKEAKEYGTCNIIEGGDVENKHVLIIEDVVSTGGQIVLSAEELRKNGAIIKEVLCVIDRELKGGANLKSHGLLLKPLFTVSELNHHS